MLAVLVGSIAYYTEEYLPAQKRLALSKSKLLIDFIKLGHLNKIVFKNVAIDTTKNEWTINKVKIKNKFIKEINLFFVNFKIQKKIKLKEIPDKKSFEKQFTRKFSLMFDKDNVNIFIGEKLAFSQDFYIKISTKDNTSYGIVKYDILINKPIKRSEYHRTDFQYLKVLAWINVTKSYFFENKK